MTTGDNPCQNCPDNCCAISGWCGLMLSKAEYAALFKQYEQRLSVREEDGIVIISAQEDCMCPHFEDGGCRIYNDRPIDCRLHPYQMRPSYELKNKVKFILHSRSACPRIEMVLIPEKDARALITDFCRQVYGEKAIVIEKCDTIAARLRNKIASLSVKFCKKIGVCR